MVTGRTRKLVGIVFAFCALPQLVSAQDVYLTKPVMAAQQVSMDQIDHSSWDQLLKKYVNEKGQVNYKGLKANRQDSNALNQYLLELSRASRTAGASKESQLAFWINAYNAVTVKGILREYPTSSIRNHTAKLIGYNIWKNLQLNVGGSNISLDSMEHEVLRKMSEPRIHFAIVCASHSCPRLLNEAYLASSLEQQLVKNTEAFFSNQENFQYNAARKSIKLSSIMKWFATDFGSNRATQLRTIAPYLPTENAKAAAQSNSVSVSYLGYDWSLNEQKTMQTKSPAGSSKR